jgi:predicted DNA-binding WGR domain protein
MLRKEFQNEFADLVRIERERNMARAYRVALWPDLFGGVILMREWGPIGRPGRLRLDSYPDADAARDAMEHLVDQKRRRGYREAA